MYIIITMSYITTITQKGQITLPQPVREFLGLLPKDKVIILRKKQEIVLKPAPSFMAMQGSIKGQKYTDKKVDKAVGQYLAKEYGEKEKKASRH